MGYTSVRGCILIEIRTKFHLIHEKICTIPLSDSNRKLKYNEVNKAFLSCSTNYVNTTNYVNKLYKSKSDVCKKSMFVGMDVHKNYLQVSVLDENGKILNNSGVDNNLITEVKYSKAKILIVHMDYTDR
jgi:hypothetical protein